MAKVFADDACLNYEGTQRYLVFLDHNVYDAGGNNNGRLDPGETADLTAILKNIGGSAFTNLNTTISCSDSYVSIIDNAGYFGSIPVDGTKENTTDPYVITASSSTPMGHTVTFAVIATEPGFADTFYFDLVVGTFHYLVWNPDPTPTPGEAVDLILTSLGYSGNYTTTLPTRGELDVYQAVLVCVGIYASNYVIDAGSPEAAALAEYVNNGGRMYLEGGDVWYYDPLLGGYDFGPLFGIDAVADGGSDLGPIVGQTGTFTEGMYFTYSGENAWMDHISPDPGASGAFLIFVDEDNVYDCAVANDAGLYRTVGTSFELGALDDSSGVSTRAALLDSIMHFFGIQPPVGTKELTESHVVRPELRIYPNPAHTSVTIGWQTYGVAGDILLKIYDASGRLVREYTAASGAAQVLWDARDTHGRAVPDGVYFIHFDMQGNKEVEKVVIIK